jgi:hypothetical protein
MTLLGLLTAPVAAAAQAVPGPAGVQGGSHVVEGQSQAVTLPVTASIGMACSFGAQAPSGRHSDADLTDGLTQHDFPLNLECTGPFKVGVVSTNGGLFANGATAPSGYTNKADYDVTLNVVRGTLVNPAQGAVTSSCTASALTSASASPCGFRGDAAIGQGLAIPGASFRQTGSFLRVSGPAPTNNLLVASNAYADTLTITVSATP